MEIEERKKFEEFAASIKNDVEVTADLIARCKSKANDGSKRRYQAAYPGIMSFVLSFHGPHTTAARSATGDNEAITASRAIAAHFSSFKIANGKAESVERWAPPYFAWLLYFHFDEAQDFLNRWSDQIPQEFISTFNRKFPATYKLLKQEDVSFVRQKLIKGAKIEEHFLQDNVNHKPVSNKPSDDQARDIEPINPIHLSSSLLSYLNSEDCTYESLGTANFYKDGLKSRFDILNDLNRRNKYLPRWYAEHEISLPYSRDLLWFVLLKTQYYGLWILGREDMPDRALPSPFYIGSEFSNLKNESGHGNSSAIFLNFPDQFTIQFRYGRYFEISVLPIDQNTCRLGIKVWGHLPFFKGNLWKRFRYRSYKNECINSPNHILELWEMGLRLKKLCYSLVRFGWPVGFIGKRFRWVQWRGVAGTLELFNDNDGVPILRKGRSLKSAELIGRIRPQSKSYKPWQKDGNFSITGFYGARLECIVKNHGDHVEDGDLLFLLSEHDERPPVTDPLLANLLSSVSVKAPESFKKVIGKRAYRFSCSYSETTFVLKGQVIGHVHVDDSDRTEVVAPVDGFLIVQSSSGHTDPDQVALIKAFPSKNPDTDLKTEQH